MITATYPAPSAPPMPKFPFLAKGKTSDGLNVLQGETYSEENENELE